LNALRGISSPSRESRSHHFIQFTAKEKSNEVDAETSCVADGRAPTINVTIATISSFKPTKTSMANWMPSTALGSEPTTDPRDRARQTIPDSSHKTFQLVERVRYQNADGLNVNEYERER
jgi:hypothetical protein